MAISLDHRGKRVIAIALRTHGVFKRGDGYMLEIGEEISQEGRVMLKVVDQGVVVNAHTSDFDVVAVQSVMGIQYISKGGCV